MTSPLVLLLGKNGQVGWELQRSLGVLGHVTALDRSGGTSACGEPLCGDLTNLDDLAATVRRLRPSVIVNAAAHTAVDKAESETHLVHTLNALAPGVLAREAEKIGAWLVHYSTDYVFNGQGEQPWVEDDATAPLNAYGRTKLDGEAAIRASGCRHLIFRTSWVYAARGGNFAKTMLKLAKERETLSVINDQFGAPTAAELIADVTAHALRQVGRPGQTAGDDGLSGTYHLAASGTTTWFDYARHVVQVAGRSQNLVVKNMLPVTSAAFPTAAQRPHNSRLNTNRLQQRFGLHMPPWQQGVERMLAEMTST